MDDDEIRDRLKRFQRDMTDLSEELVNFGKRKANADDVELVARKLGVLEEEVRVKFGSIHSDNQEIRHALRTLIESVDNLRSDLSHHKRETAEELKDKAKNRMFANVPPWMWLLVGVGGLALMQLGPSLWLDIKNLAP
jgi:chromosome segregation ATPase